jgi:hypothetical protein
MGNVFQDAILQVAKEFRVKDITFIDRPIERMVAYILNNISTP